MERRLGRGLGSLLGETEVPAGTGQVGEEAKGLIQVELDRIRTNPFQPRKNMDAAGLEELREQGTIELIDG